MKKLPHFWIEYAADWRVAPMAYWAHVQKGEEPWYRATAFEPAAPSPDGKLGYPVLCVESCGMTFQFTSRAQLEACIKTLSSKPLPSTRRLTALRGGAGPNGHWLSRLPANVKSPKGRQQAIADLTLVAQDNALHASFNPA